MRPVAVTGAAAVLDRALDEALDALPAVIRARALRAERVTQLALAAAGVALERAGHAAGEGAPCPQHGIVLGTAFGCFLTNAAYQRRLATHGVRVASPRLFAATVSNAAAGEVSIAYRLGGPAVTLSAGAAAGLVAIGHAAEQVASGRADVVVAGGMDARGPELERWLADGGLAIGEGPIRDAAAVVVLEPARADGWWARVLGHAHGYAPPGDHGAATVTVRRALDDAGVGPADVAVAVPLGARAAAHALDAVLGAVPVPVTSGRPREAAETFAAGGPLALLDALAGAPASASVLVVQACASGHVAALVAARGENA
jgi:3-oxoacyl-[acyl-carrier-protein] synthase II